MLQITQKEYDAKHPDFKGTWTTERDDLPDWDEIRDQYMGKRTMLGNNDGRTCLLIEGMHFEIVEEK